MKTFVKTILVTAAFAFASNSIQAQTSAPQDSMKRQNRMHTMPVDSTRNNSKINQDKINRSTTTPSNQNKNSSGNGIGSNSDSSNYNRSTRDSLK